MRGKGVGLCCVGRGEYEAALAIGFLGESWVEGWWVGVLVCEVEEGGLGMRRGVDC